MLEECLGWILEESASCEDLRDYWMGICDVKKDNNSTCKLIWYML